MEDIGVLPAKSIAEAIAALPGVAGARNDEGAISQLSVRGTTDLDSFVGTEFTTIVVTTLISFNVSYDFSENFRISFFGYNIGDEQRRKYSGGISERTEFNQYYRETYGAKIFYRL